MLADLENYLLRIKATTLAKVEFSRSSLSASAGRLEALSPLATLQRGYAAVYKPSSGVIVRVFLSLSKEKIFLSDSQMALLAVKSGR